MDALAGLASETQQASSRTDGRLDIAHNNMALPVTGHGQAAPFFEAVFVFGVEGRAALDRAQDGFDTFIILDQEVACRGAHEDFHATAAEHLFHLGQQDDILVRRARIERMVGIHAPLGAGQLVGQGLGRGR